MFDRGNLGRLVGYLLVATLTFVFSYLAMGFLAMDLDVTNWDEYRRGVVGMWTLILFGLYVFESRKS